MPLNLKKEGNGLAQSDIDKILEDIKKRKEMSGQKSDSTQPLKEALRHEKTEEIRAEAAGEKEHSEISPEGKQTLSDFINNSMSESKNDGEENGGFYSPEFISKKSEDYIDENFMDFFTTSVIVTKKPENTGNVQIKRKKVGFFKRKYITDSLSLNVEKPEEDEEKISKKERRRIEKAKNADSLPIVKTAGDVWAEKLEREEAEYSEREDLSAEKARNTETSHKVANTEETVKIYKPKQSASSLNDILGDDKDPESLAKRILRQRKRTVQSSAAVATKEKEEADTEMPQRENGSVKTAQAPGEDGGIISSIYTSVIEKQAREALAADEMTSFIPEFEEDEPEEKETVTVEQREEEPEKVFEEYISKSEFFDKPDSESEDILGELMQFRQTLNLRIILGFVCGGILIYLNMSAVKNLPVPDFISPSRQPMMFSLACALVYTIAFIGFLPTVFSGFASLKGSPAPDSFISLGSVLAFVQLLVMAIFSAKIDISKVTVFAAFICVAFAFNAMGKKISTNTIIKNLSLANAPSGINAGYIVTDTDAVKRLARTLDEKVPRVLVSRKTGSITNFVNAGFSIHKSDYLARKSAIAAYAVTAVCFVMGLILSKDFPTAVFSAAGASVLMIPLSQTLVNSVPSALMQKTLEKVGALVNGWQGIDQLSNTTHVNFDAKHMFPRGTVILHGIKTFEKERIDLAILYAASVLIKECDVLRPVFMDVIDGKTDILSDADSCEYIEQQGYVSWINNSRVIIGNRTLMEKYEVAMPPVSMESKFTNRGRKPVYLAVGGKLFGMFVFSYRPDPIVKDNLEKLIDKGVSIILSSKDFNIDPHLIESVYGIPSDYVSVLNQKEANLLTQFTCYTDESECCVAHLDSLSSLVAGFCGAESAKSAESVCSIIQTVSVVIGAVLAVLFTYSQTIMSLPLTSILLLSFGFMGLAMLTAVAKKYE